MAGLQDVIACESMPSDLNIYLVGCAPGPSPLRGPPTPWMAAVPTVLGRPSLLSSASRHSFCRSDCRSPAKLDIHLLLLPFAELRVPCSPDDILFDSPQTISHPLNSSRWRLQWPPQRLVSHRSSVLATTTETSLCRRGVYTVSQSIGRRLWWA